MEQMAKRWTSHRFPNDNSADNWVSTSNHASSLPVDPTQLKESLPHFELPLPTQPVPFSQEHDPQQDEVTAGDDTKISMGTLTEVTASYIPTRSTVTNNTRPSQQSPSFYSTRQVGIRACNYVGAFVLAWTVPTIARCMQKVWPSPSTYWDRMVHCH